MEEETYTRSDGVIIGNFGDLTTQISRFQFFRQLVLTLDERTEAPTQFSSALVHFTTSGMKKCSLDRFDERPILIRGIVELGRLVDGRCGRCWCYRIRRWCPIEPNEINNAFFQPRSNGLKMRKTERTIDQREVLKLVRRIQVLPPAEHFQTILLQQLEREQRPKD